MLGGETKATYNHFDSYPEGLGNVVKRFIVDNDKDSIVEAFKKIRLVKADSVPTKEDIDKYKEFYDERVNGGSLEDYYALLRDVQGKPQTYIDDDIDIMIDNLSFIQDSLFCEWAYIINLDNDTLEIYEGFRKSPPKNNRYALDKCDNQGYYPCEMIKVVPFSELSNFKMESLERDDD